MSPFKGDQHHAYHPNGSRTCMQFTLGMPFLGVLGKFYRNLKGLIFINPQYTVLRILSYCTSYSLFCFIICSYFHSHLYLYIFSCVMFHCFIFIIFFLLFFFALSIERTCPDLHFTTDYTLYDCVYDEK